MESARSTILFGYATLLAEDGREMHKSWGNSIEFNEAADKMGADTMRWLYASAQTGTKFALRLQPKGDETRRRFLIPLWNVYSFFVSYANLDGWLPGAETAVSPNPAHAQMDKWIVERVKETAAAVRAALDKYDAEKATRELEALLDDVSNWYVRRSRRRFWKSEADDDKNGRLRHAVPRPGRFRQAAGPLHPLRHRGDVPEPGRGLVDEARRPACTTPSIPAARGKNSTSACWTRCAWRSPRPAWAVRRAVPPTSSCASRLAKARVNVGTQQEQDDLVELAEVLQEEINVKEFEVVSEVGELVNYKLMPNNRVLGPRLGSAFPKVKAALDEIDAADAARALQAGKTVRVSAAGETYELDAEDVLVQTESRGGLAVASDKGVTVAVDTALSPRLIREGYARDLVRAINNMRKDAGLDISDRIEVAYVAAGEAAAALQDFAEYIQQETLAVALEPGTLPDAAFQGQVGVGDEDVHISLRIAA